MTPSEQLPPKPSLRQLRNQAKDLLQSAPGWRTGRHPPDRRISSAIFRLVSGRNRRCGDRPGGRTARDCAGVGL